MISIAINFKQISEKNIQKNLHLSSLSCFIRVIRGREFDRRTIMEYFNKLVDCEDYINGGKKELINYLLAVSGDLKCARGVYKIGGKRPFLGGNWLKLNTSTFYELCPLCNK